MITPIEEEELGYSGSQYGQEQYYTFSQNINQSKKVSCDPSETNDNLKFENEKEEEKSESQRSVNFISD